MAELADEGKCPFFSIFSDIGASGRARCVRLTATHRFLLSGVATPDPYDRGGVRERRGGPTRSVGREQARRRPPLLNLGRTSTGWIAPACGWRTHSITSSACSHSGRPPKMKTNPAQLEAPWPTLPRYLV